MIPLALGLAVVWLGVGIYWDRLNQRQKDAALLVLLGSWLTALVMLTLLPQGELLDADGRATQHLVNLVPFSDIADTTTRAVTWRVGVEQVAGNLALFVPLGVIAFLLADHGRIPVWLAWSLGPLIGSAVELTQRILPLGRATTTDDVILATVGSGLGLIAAHLIRHRRGTGRGESRTAGSRSTN